MSRDWIQAELDDQEPEDEDNPPKLKVRMSYADGGILISPEGYGDNASAPGHGSPVIIELCKGELRVLVWDDINKEEPSHVISLENAKETNRKGD